MSGPLPGGLPYVKQTAPCPCRRGRTFKKCCGSGSNAPRRSSGHRRLLVIGAGASIAECIESGAEPDKPLPGIRNFAATAFNESQPLTLVVAAYLDARGIPFDDTIVRAYQTDIPNTISSEQMNGGPRCVFQQLEAADSHTHNVERLFEFVWRTFGTDHEMWEALAWDGVFTYLFNAFITQFGFGPAHSIRDLRAGRAVSERLFPSDRVLNLNYDLAFDLALQQAPRYFTYAPEVRKGAISVYKPHGSFNLYSNTKNGDCFFADPSEVRGSVALRDSSGGVWSPAAAIVPPRLEKSYAQHPNAAMILEGLTTFRPEIVTFWGVGMTPSDVDLTDLYRGVCRTANRIEFINPDRSAYDTASRILGTTPHHFTDWKAWLSGTPD